MIKIPKLYSLVTELYDSLPEKSYAISNISKLIAEKYGIEYNDNLRKRIEYHIKKYKNISGFSNGASGVDVDPDAVPYMWLKTKNASVFVKNPNFNESQVDYQSIIDSCFDHREPVKKEQPKANKMIDRLIWTDVHIGMSTNVNGNALYPTEWNKDVLMNRLDQMIRFVVDNKTSNILYIDDLGDYMDGWNGETTRGGHKLPQNMSNEEAFDTGLKAKMYLVDTLVNHYDQIICHNVCNDNHSGSFAYVVNQAFKQVVDHKYTNVFVRNYNKFISHYIVGQHGFILSHGKDSKNMKFGFKPILDPKTLDKITQYIRHNSDLMMCKYIEFSKGDSHQCLFDMCTSDEFDYFNFPAFSPSSDWVQINFKKGRSGFVLQNIDVQSDRKNIKPFFFS